MKTGHLTDFPDRFSPMLVKELRQGLRARIFTAIFLCMQLLLGLLLLGAMLASESERTGSIVSGIILTFFIIAVVLIQPLRGMGALSGEMRDHTIDLMTLTRLTSWRIVLGKWVAIVSQSALLLVTIIPYLILRYFFGGMNLLAEITVLICLFAASMALTAFTVGLSGCRLAVARILIPVALVIIMFFVLLNISFSMAMSGGSGGIFGGPASTSDNLWRVAMLLATFTYLGHQSLSMGASLIASAAENHALTRRLVTLGAMAVLAATAVFYESGSPDKILGYLFFPLIAAPAVVIALTESNHVAPGLIARFRKRGIAGLITAAFLIPGRASGYFFTLLLAALAFGLLMLMNAPDIDMVIRLLGMWGSLLFPAAALQFLQRGDGQRIGAYLLILFSTLVLWVILQSFAQVAGDSAMLIFAWCPIVFTLGDVDAFDSASGWLMIFAVLFILNAILATSAIRELKSVLKSTLAAPTDPS
ncbi:MAG: hypothetical protein ACNA8L_06730 [Luteolibacter sp.]